MWLLATRSSPRADAPAGRRAWLSRHPAAAAALVYAVLSVLLYAPALVPGHTLSASDYLWSAAPWAAERPPDIPVLGSNYELVDAVTQFQPWLEHSRERLPSPPLWNPHVAAGRPFLANAQSAVLSPFSVPAYVLPFWWSLGVIAVLKVFVAAFGTYLLARALGMRFGGALMAGIVYAFSLYFIVWIAWPQTNVWALLPWLFLLADRALRAPTVLSGAGLAVVVALQFLGGHPESNFHLLVATVAFFAFRVVVLRRRRALAELRRPLLAFSAGLAGGAALAAVALVPFLELLFRSADMDVRETYWELALPERYLLGFLLPDYWGRATHAAVGAFAQERALYVGALPLMLAIGAVVARPTLQRVGLAAFGALLLAIAVGVPPLPQIASAIPIVKTGNHLRVVVILMLCLALLAGFGLDDLAGRRLRRHRAILGIAAGLLVLPVLVLAARGELSAGLFPRALEVAAGIDWPSPPPEGDDLTAIRMGSLVEWLVFAGLAVLLLAAALRRRLGGAALIVLACLLAAGDLFKAGMGATPAISTDEATQPSTPGDRVPRGPPSQPLRGARPAARPLAAHPEPGSAVVALRRAQLRPPGRGALRRPVATRGRRRGPDRPPDLAGPAHEARPARVPAPERHGHRPGPGRPSGPRSGSAGRLRPPRPPRLRQPACAPARGRGRRAARRGERGGRARRGARPELRRAPDGRDLDSAARPARGPAGRARRQRPHRRLRARARGRGGHRPAARRARADRPPLPGVEGGAGRRERGPASRELPASRDQSARGKAPRGVPLRARRLAARLDRQPGRPRGTGRRRLRGAAWAA